MEFRVAIRDLEERDVDFIYNSKRNQTTESLTIKGHKDLSYDETIAWLNRCINNDGTYRYWAICTNDEFQNIIGWCSLSKIDYENSEACLYGITVANSKYNDGEALVLSCLHLVHYVFEVLKFNRIYASCLTEQYNTKVFLDIILRNSDSIEKEAVLRNERLYDIAMYSLERERYEQLKTNGGLEFDACVERLEKALMQTSEAKCITLAEFIETIKRRLSQSKPASVTSNTKFRDLDEWSSLFAFEIVATVSSLFNVRFDVYDINRCETLEDLYKMAIKKSCKKIG